MQPIVKTIINKLAAKDAMPSTSVGSCHSRSGTQSH